LYIALSYCWGSLTQVFRTTKANYSSMLKGFDVKLLPAVIFDSVIFCRAIGVCYLWVDSLCIIQDDISDWEREAGKMGSVYGRSMLVISATLSSNSSEGFITNRQGKSSVKFPWLDSATIRSGSVSLTQGRRGFSRLLHDSPLMTRGWALQERFLATRVLHFADQIFWECWEAIWSEDSRFYERLAGLSPKPNYLVPKAKGGYFKDDFWGRLKYQDVKDRWTKFEYWSKVVKEFCHRKLTEPMDKLAAVKGIAEALMINYADEYFFGIWKSTLDLDLVWRRQMKPYLTAPSKYRAPSWSWAALDGEITPWFTSGYVSLNETIGHEVLPEVRLADNTLPGSNTFRPTEGFYIEIVGPVTESRFLEPNEGFDIDDPEGIEMVQDGFNCEFLVTDTASPNLWTAVFDQQPNRETGIYHLIRIGIDIAFEENEEKLTRAVLGLKYWALIIQPDAHPSVDRRPMYKRVGVAWLSVPLSTIRQRKYTSFSNILWTDHSSNDWASIRVGIL
jgi:hypothetical protein